MTTSATTTDSAAGDMVITNVYRARRADITEKLRRLKG